MLKLYFCINLQDEVGLRILMMQIRTFPSGAPMEEQ